MSERFFCAVFCKNSLFSARIIEVNSYFAIIKVDKYVITQIMNKFFNEEVLEINEHFYFMKLLDCVFLISQMH